MCVCVSGASPSVKACMFYAYFCRPSINDAVDGGRRHVRRHAAMAVDADKVVLLDVYSGTPLTRHELLLALGGALDGADVVAPVGMPAFPWCWGRIVNVNLALLVG